MKNPSISSAPKIRIQESLLIELDHAAQHLAPGAGMSRIQMVSVAIRGWLDARPKVLTDTPTRITTIAGLDYVLGGGLMPSSVTLFDGKAGVGKTTLALQASGRIASDGHKVLYVSVDQSLKELKQYAIKIGVSPLLRAVHVQNINEIIEAISKSKAAVVVIDSLQMVNVDEYKTGTTQAIKLATRALCEYVIANSAAIIVIDNCAGSSVIAHYVDVVLELTSRRGTSKCVLSCPQKNRFGEAGPHVKTTFEMTAHGLVEE